MKQTWQTIQPKDFATWWAWMGESANMKPYWDFNFVLWQCDFFFHFTLLHIYNFHNVACRCNDRWVSSLNCNILRQFLVISPFPPQPLSHFISMLYICNFLKLLTASITMIYTLHGWRLWHYVDCCYCSFVIGF